MVAELKGAKRQAKVCTYRLRQVFESVGEAD